MFDRCSVVCVLICAGHLLPCCSHRSPGFFQDHCLEPTLRLRLLNKVDIMNDVSALITSFSFVSGKTTFCVADA